MFYNFIACFILLVIASLGPFRTRICRDRTACKGPQATRINVYETEIETACRVAIQWTHEKSCEGPRSLNTKHSDMLLELF